MMGKAFAAPEPASSTILGTILGTLLVTGASGFIGRHLVRALLDNQAQVKCLSRSNRAPPGAATVLADLGDFEAVLSAMQGVDTLLHLGGLASVDAAAEAPAEAFRVNTLGTQNVLEAARRSGVRRVVLLSTAHVFGRPATLPLTEDHPFSPMTCYAATKLAADVLAAGYHRDYGLATTVLRPLNVYGPGQGGAAVIPTIIGQALTQSRISVRDPSVQRDFMYVDDLVAAILAAASGKRAIGRELLLASGRAMPVGAIMQCVARLTGARIEEPVATPSGQTDCIYGSTRRAETLLGWAPRVEIEEGLARTVTWWREQIRS